MQTLFYQLTANEFRIQQDDQSIKQGMGLSHIAAQIKTQTLHPLSIEQAI
ncbi:hypothetical protein [Acinetobacter sp. NCu2D-2]|nr:hypothetical protein [Acinetobacter sp. NCu2D-2]